MTGPPTLLRRVRAAGRFRPAAPADAGANDGLPASAVGRRRRRGLALAGLVAVAGGVAWLVAGGDSGERPAGASRSGATATVERQTLVEREDVDGTLGYSGKRTVVHRSESSAGGSGGGLGDGASADGARAAADATPAADTTPAASTASTAMVAVAAVEEPPEDQGPNPPEDQADQEAPARDEPEQKDPARDEEQPSDGTQEAPATGQPTEDEPAADDPDDEAATPTLTAVARAGTVVRRGGVLYRASGEPVVLMYGSVPAYRSLSSGVAEGRDVLQLERNLAALGYGDLTVDEDFSESTAAAVREWQEDLGVEETGSVELGQVVFLPGARRMGARKTAIGSLLGDGSEVVDTTSTRRVVKIELEASDQGLAKEGARVTVTLPDGRRVDGRVSSVGRVAREQESESGDLGGDGSSGEPVIDVTVTLNRTHATGGLDEAPVTVGLAIERRRKVLAVPVTALLARQGGGYAVEVVDGGSRRNVPVDTGLYASGLVEVEGRGIGEGMQVSVPE